MCRKLFNGIILLSLIIFSKTDALFSTQYSDSVDLLTQHLVRRLERLQEQVEYARDNPGRKADLVVEVVRDEMRNNLVFAKHASD